MKYLDLINAHAKYGNKPEDIIAHKDLSNVLENVVIAPWWGHEMYEERDCTVEKVGKHLYNIIGKNYKFSHIELKAIGSPKMMDEVLTLGVTKCKNIIFVGSVGSLDESIKIGDIVLPIKSICGDGASRYLNDNLEDDFGKPFYPDKEMYQKLLAVVKRESKLNDVVFHETINFSIDTVFSQFYHIDKIKELGCKTVEMESATAFKCANLAGLNMVAIFCVSDNTIVNKSLLSGRTDKENEYRHKVRYEVITKIIEEIFRNN